MRRRAEAGLALPVRLLLDPVWPLRRPFALFHGPDGRLPDWLPGIDRPGVSQLAMLSVTMKMTWMNSTVSTRGPISANTARRSGWRKVGHQRTR